MILPLLPFPSPPSALCTFLASAVCPVLWSLSPCPVSSGPSLFFLSWGALGGGGAFLLWGGGSAARGVQQGLTIWRLAKLDRWAEGGQSHLWREKSPGHIEVLCWDACPHPTPVQRTLDCGALMDILDNVRRGSAA